MTAASGPASCSSPSSPPLDDEDDAERNPSSSAVSLLPFAPPRSILLSLLLQQLVPEVQISVLPEVQKSLMGGGTRLFLSISPIPVLVTEVLEVESPLSQSFIKVMASKAALNSWE
eukprot:GHVU01156670.1.p2 GENE.GHVU01156670.1~~GHVU01156670.1.p2  ORF type:complete len:116 (-),score=12.68 GHVU01156670.1:78-425(-)